jgi:hypothetical protein
MRTLYQNGAQVRVPGRANHCPSGVQARVSGQGEKHHERPNDCCSHNIKSPFSASKT